MASKSSIVEVEFDGPQNQCVQFRPIQRKLRGRFDSHRVAGGGKLISKWPQPIPGQRLVVDTATGEVSIREPLHDAEHAATRERIEAAGHRIGPEVEKCGVVDMPTLHYWLSDLVADGLAKVISGELPAKVEGKPRLRFHSAEQVDPIDRLCEAIENQTSMMTKLLEKLAG